MTEEQRKELLRAYFAGQWMIGQLLAGSDDIRAEDCWATADAMLEKMK